MSECKGGGVSFWDLICIWIMFWCYFGSCSEQKQKREEATEMTDILRRIEKEIKRNAKE